MLPSELVSHVCLSVYRPLSLFPCRSKLCSHALWSGDADPIGRWRGEQSAGTRQHQGRDETGIDGLRCVCVGPLRIHKPECVPYAQITLGMHQVIRFKNLRSPDWVIPAVTAKISPEDGTDPSICIGRLDWIVAKDMLPITSLAPRWCIQYL